MHTQCNDHNHMLSISYAPFPPPGARSSMASNLLLPPFRVFPLSSGDYTKHPPKTPALSLHPLNLWSFSSFSESYSSSRRRASVAQAVKEEVIQSPNLEPTLDSKTSPPSSAKLVLVVGGTGGVGMHSSGSLLVHAHIIDFLVFRNCSGFCCY